MPGEVVIQTYLPDGEAVQCARTHDFLAFAGLEMESRMSVGYPPFGRMALLLFKGRDGHAVGATAGKCSEWLRGCSPPQVEVLGPVEAPLARIRGNYRWHIILKSTSPPRLNALARETRAQFGGKAGRGAGTVLEVNVDPVSML